MSTTNNNQNQIENLALCEYLLDSIKVLTDLTLRDSERSCNIENSQVIETNDNNLSHQSLRKVIA